MVDGLGKFSKEDLLHLMSQGIRPIMAHDVFISYSTQDKTIANAACAMIEEARIRCWIAPRDVLETAKRGDLLEYGESLIEAILQSKVLVLVLSSSSNDSKFVKKEVEIAVSQGIVIIPFKVEDFQLSSSMRFFLAGIHWLDAISPPLEDHLKKLVSTIHRLLDSDPGIASRSSGSDLRGFVPISGQILPVTGAPSRLGHRNLAIAVVSVGLLILIVSGGILALTTRGQKAEVVAKIDPCSPEALPPVKEPEMPENSPPVDSDRPVMPPDPKQTICSITIRNETGKPLRIWRHVLRPKDHLDYSKWRQWLACPSSPPPPPSVAGWAYFIVENLDDNAGKTMSEAHNYYIVGWKYLKYGGFATIRLKSNFFENPENDEFFSISYAH